MASPHLGKETTPTCAITSQASVLQKRVKVTRNDSLLTLGNKRIQQIQFQTPGEISVLR